MIRSAAVFGFTILMLCGLLTPGTAADHIPVPTNGGYVVPIYGENEEIFDLYRSPNGHIASLFCYGDRGSYKCDFYDTQTKKRLFPEQEVALAHTPFLKIAPVGYEKIGTHFPNPATAPHGNKVGYAYEGTQKGCPPYYQTLTIQRAGLAPQKFTLLQKLSKPAVWHLSGICGTGHALIHYHGLTMHFIAVDDTGFYAAIYGYPARIHFDWNGHSKFFAGREDIIFVPSEELRQILDKNWQDRIGNAETVIASFAARQMKDTEQ